VQGHLEQFQLSASLPWVCCERANAAPVAPHLHKEEKSKFQAISIGFLSTVRPVQNKSQHLK
jgi:hypothetical protein